MSNNKLHLGRLERVDLRKAWASEATDFTPWLAEEKNIALLGDTIGMELEVESQEKDVGPFRADLLCRDTATDHWVLIENQLERTDHTHLGQLITYAAGLNAVTIVWIAERFTDEHRAALDWINEITAENIAFFGLEVELWRIGDSPIAPKFNIVSSPNDWTKRGPIARSHSAGKSLQLEFWSNFREYVNSNGATFKPTKPTPTNHMSISIGRSGVRLNAVASLYDVQAGNYSKHELRAELKLYDENAKTYFLQLANAKEQIQHELGEALVWHNPDNSIRCRIYVQKTVDLNNRDKWPEFFGWLKEKLEKLRKVFRPRVKTLQADAMEADE